MPQDKTKPKSDTSGFIIAKYQATISRLVLESDILWTRFSAMLLFNSILITTIGFAYDPESYLPIVFRNFLPIAGLISCLPWYSVTIRGFQWIKLWREKAKIIEEDMKGGPITDADSENSSIVGWPHTQSASKIVIGLIAMVYIVLLFNVLFCYDKNFLTHRTNRTYTRIQLR